MIERRGFIQTLIGGITSAGVLLKATPSEVKAFGAVNGQAVILSPQAIAPPPSAIVMPGETLYAAAGKAVAMVESITVDTGMIDVTHFGDTSRNYYEGTRTMRIEAIGLPDYVARLR
jgi:hypothetical protein